MDDSRHQNTKDALFSEATAWFFRLGADDVSVAEEQDFSDWLAVDPAHREAWDEVTSLMGALRAPAAAVHRADGAAAPSRVSAPWVASIRGPGVRWAGLTLAACVGAFLVVEGPVLLDRWRADHATGAGQREVLRLAEGTRIELDSDTAIETELSPEVRRIRVLRGEAFFAVAADPRPFVVASGDGEIRDIGTAFSVSRHEPLSTVVVESGIVDVRARRGSGQDVRVNARQAVDFADGTVSPVREVDPDEKLAWRHGRIVFRQEKLSGVVEQLNRYRRGRIVIINPWIADQPVSGAFEIGNPDAPIEALEAVLGVKALALTPYLVTLR